MKIYAALVAILLSSFLVRAQESVPFNTSRPGQAFTPLTLGKSALQLQSGFRIAENWESFEGFNLPLFYFATFSNSTTVRYGISDRVELRADVDWSKDYQRLFEQRPTAFGSGFSRLSLGSRILVIKDDEQSQYLSLQPRVDIPVNQGGLSGQPLPFQLLVAYSRPLFTKTTLTTNLAWGQSTQWGDGQVDYVLNFAFQITDKLSCFAEHYGTFVENELLLSWDGGLAIMLGSDLQLDLSAGFGKVSSPVILEMHQWFVDTGVSWRIFDGVSKRN